MQTAATKPDTAAKPDDASHADTAPIPQKTHKKSKRGNTDAHIHRRKIHTKTNQQQPHRNPTNRKKRRQSKKSRNKTDQQRTQTIHPTPKLPHPHPPKRRPIRRRMVVQLRQHIPTTLGRSNIPTRQLEKQPRREKRKTARRKTQPQNISQHEKHTKRRERKIVIIVILRRRPSKKSWWINLEIEELREIEKKIADFTDWAFNDYCKEICGSDDVTSCCKDCNKAEGLLPEDREFIVTVSKDMNEFDWVGNYPREVVDILKEDFNFDDERGFLGENGCKLPRKYRSAICLCESCSAVKKKVKPKLEEDYELIFDNLRKFISIVRKRKFEKLEEDKFGE